MYTNTSLFPFFSSPRSSMYFNPFFAHIVVDRASDNPDRNPTYLLITKNRELFTNAPLFVIPNSNPKNTKIVLKISSYLHMACFLGPLFYLAFFGFISLNISTNPNFMQVRDKYGSRRKQQIFIENIPYRSGYPSVPCQLCQHRHSGDSVCLP